MLGSKQSSSKNTKTFFKISFVFHRGKVCIHMRANKQQNFLFLVEYPFNGSWTPARILQFVPKRYSDIFYLWSSRALYFMKMHSEQGLNGGSKLLNACVTVPVCEPEPHKIPLMLTWLWERAQREEVAAVPFQSTVPFHLILPSFLPLTQIRGLGHTASVSPSIQDNAAKSLVR